MYTCSYCVTKRAAVRSSVLAVLAVLLDALAGAPGIACRLSGQQGSLGLRSKGPSPTLVMLPAATCSHSCTAQGAPSQQLSPAAK